MKKTVVLLFASLLWFGAHADGAKEATKQEQIRKLRAQAAAAHGRGDALSAQAEKLELESDMNPGEKLRGGPVGKPEKRQIAGQCGNDGRAGCALSGK